MKNRPQYAIDSVDHALYLAQLLQQEGPLGVTQAAERLSVARSTAHRLLAPGRPCNTFDTVGADTPARSAIRATLISERNRPSLDPSRPAAVTTADYGKHPAAPCHQRGSRFPKNWVRSVP